MTPVTRPVRYSYAIKTLADVRKNATVFVPNSSAKEAVEIWKWLSGYCKDFPQYNEGDLLIVGIDEDAWCSPKVYREGYCPLEMTCIVREIA